MTHHALIPDGTPMRRRFGRYLALATAVGAALAAAPAGADPARFVGTWIDHTGRGAVEFTRCGNSLCGRIVWLKEPNDASGKPLTDGNNPDPGRRSTPICGLQIIGEAKQQGDGTFDQGWIYDPEEGKRYSVELRPVSPNVIAIHGYAGIKFLGETYTWKRAPTNLARCSA